MMRFIPRQLLLRCSTSCITHRDVGNADFAWSKISAHAVVSIFTALEEVHSMKNLIFGKIKKVSW